MQIVVLCLALSRQLELQQLDKMRPAAEFVRGGLIESMAKHPGLQFLRFLKAYYKITNAPVIDIQKIDKKVFIDLSKENKWIITATTNNAENTLMRISMPQISACPSLPDILNGWLENGYEDADNLEISHKSHLVINDPNNSTYINFEADSKRVEAFEKFQGVRGQWLAEFHQAQKALKIHAQISLLYNRFDSSNTDKRLLLGNGLLQLDSQHSCINFPLILQPVGLIRSNNDFIIKKIGPASFNTEVLTAIPGISAQAIEDSIKLFNATVINLPGQTETQLFLAKVFKLVTSGNKNWISINNSPVLFYNTPDLPYSELINKSLNDAALTEDCGALQSIFNEKQDNSRTLADDYAHLHRFFALHYDLNSLNALNSLSTENICLITAPNGTAKDNIIVNSLSHYLHHNRSVLVISPSQSYLDCLKNKLPTAITGLSSAKSKKLPELEGLVADRTNLINSLISTQQELLKSYAQTAEVNNKYKAARQKLKKVEAQFSSISKDTSQLYWDNQAVYRKGMLNELLASIDSLLIEEFTLMPATRLIADQNTVEGLYQRWTALIEHIDEYRAYGHQDSKTPSVNIEIKNYPNLKILQQSINEIISHIKQRGRLRKLDYQFKKDWKEIVTSCFVNQKKPDQYEDFLALKHVVDRALSKSEIIKEWSNLACPAGLPELEVEDGLFEKIIDLYYKPVVSSINWFNDVWHPFISALLATGFKWKEFFSQYSQQYIEYGFVNTLYDRALHQLKELISSRVKYTQEAHQACVLSDKQPMASSPERTTELSNNLKKMTSYLKDLQIVSEEILSCSPIENLNFTTWSDFVQNQLQPAKMYDLVIVDAAEQFDIFGLLALYYTDKCLFIGDDCQSIKPQKTVTNTIIELSKSLLHGVVNSEVFYGNYSLYGIISKSPVKHIYLTRNTVNPPLITDFISDLCYDNKLLAYQKEDNSSSMFSINLSDKIDSNNDLSKINYLRHLITELDTEKSENSLAVVEMSGDYCTSKLHELKDTIANIAIHTLSEVADSKFDIVIAVDLHEKSANSTTELSTDQQKARFNIALGAAKAVFCYVYDSQPDSAISELQKKLIQYIDDNKATAPSGRLLGPFSEAVDSIIQDKGLRAVEKILVNGRLVDILILAKEPIAVIDIYSVEGDFKELLSWHLSLSRNGYRVFFADFEENNEHVLAEIKQLPLESCLTDDISDFADLLLQIDQKWRSVSTTAHTQATDYIESDSANPFDNVIISEKEIKISQQEELLLESSNSGTSFGKHVINPESKTHRQSLTDVSGETSLRLKANDSAAKMAAASEENLFPGKRFNIDKKYEFSIPESDLNNKAALFNFGHSDAEHPVVKSNDDNDSKSPDFESDQDTLSNSVKSITSDELTETNASSFDIINWLKENDYEYIDLRPAGHLWVIDQPDIGPVLRGLQTKGFYFSLSVKSSELPRNCSAWRLIEK